MVEAIKSTKTHEVMGLSGDVEEVTVNYRELLLTGLFGLNPDNPGDLVDGLIEYRKLH